MTRAPARQLVQLGPGDLADRLTEALHVYVAAMGYPTSTARHRRTLWLEHVQRPGWRAVGWVDAADTLLGIAYGYTGGPGQWWYQEVRRGLAAAGPEAQLWLQDYFELTELHVRPDVQGDGVGEALARRLLTRPTDRHVLLSTPEAEQPTRAWSLYRRLGFRDLLRRHRFTSDPRPFAVLGRELPLDPPHAPVPPVDGDGTVPWGRA